MQRYSSVPSSGMMQSSGIPSTTVQAPVVETTMTVISPEHLQAHLDLKSQLISHLQTQIGKLFMENQRLKSQLGSSASSWSGVPVQTSAPSSLPVQAPVQAPIQAPMQAPISQPMVQREVPSEVLQRGVTGEIPQSEIGNLKERIGWLESELKLKESELEQLRGQMRESSMRESEWGSWRPKYEQLSKEYFGKQREWETEKARMKERKKYWKNQHKQHSQGSQEWNRQMELLKSQLSNAERQLSGLRSENEKLVNQIQQLQSMPKEVPQNKEWERENRALKVKLEKERHLLGETRTALESQLNVLRGKLGKLEERLVEMTSLLESKRRQMESTHNDIEQMKQAFAESEARLMRELNNTKQSLEMAQGETIGRNAKYQELLTKYHDLERQLQASRIATAEARSENVTPVAVPVAVPYAVPVVPVGPGYVESQSIPAEKYVTEVRTPEPSRIGKA